MRAGYLNQRIAVEYKSGAVDPVFGGEQITWIELTKAWANVSEINSAESVNSGLRASIRTITVTTRWIPGLTSDMRIRSLSDGKILQIVSLAQMPKRRGWNIVCDEYSVEP